MFNAHRFLDAFYILEAGSGFSELKHVAWKKGHKHYKVVKIRNHIFIAGDDFKHGL